ncbi:PhzF family phenazine biosynthesis protein [Permianibacter aggregans]|uniref:PhzF family phenazine biosynthesis protein n=1 Tax=Permianibacter aggregans TaxID=1510150 RepID=A0A4R6URC8_9GAMM|nr:PhzF family phenazine biosynthesis protein [Permianibacter aggregans]TDQ48143.1 PhzF family phenazine biosynthesis protein [Permianibacter aggregans]
MSAEPQSFLTMAFTDEHGNGGNPAGVVLDSGAMREQEKQKLAAKLGYSETAFVDGIDGNRIRLQFFTPNKPIADCGHATIGAFSLLRSKGLIGEGEFIKVLNAGERIIEVNADQIWMQVAPPRFSPSPDEVVIAQALHSLGLDPAQMPLASAPAMVSTGAPFLLLELREREQLAALRPSQAAIEQLSMAHGLIGFYVFVQTASGHYDAAARMFAPAFGIDEESATGMAAGALTALLHQRTGIIRLTIAQGDWMTPPSPSRLYSEVRSFSRDQADIWVGGRGAYRR